jgi:hypothetical protein
MSTPLRERPDAPLGTLIFRAGLLPAETIENALEEGVKTGRRLGEILVERGLIKEEDLTRLLAGQKGLPFVSLRERSVDPEAGRLLAEDQARLFTALPIGFEDGVPLVAVADPTNDVLNRNIREALGQEARFVVAARSELNEVIGEVFAGPLPTPAPTTDFSVPAPEPDELSVVAPEPEPVAATEVAPAADEALPDVASTFDVSAYEPQPAVEAEQDPDPDPAPEREPLTAPYAAPAPAAGAGHASPAEEPVDPEPPAEPEPALPVAPLVTEPAASQSVQQSNGQVPEDFEDDSPPPAAPAEDAGYRVSIRLTSGERITVADCADAGEAKGYAKALTKQLGSTDSDDWPFVNGRFLKPDTIVSVDVESI